MPKTALRWLLALGLLGATMVVLGCAVASYVWIADSVTEATERAEAQAELRVAAQRLGGDIAAPAGDVRVLAQLPAVARIVSGPFSPGESHGPDAASREAGEIAAWFRDIALAKKTFRQIRVIDAAGHERIRVERDGDAVRVAPLAMLQDKADRYYFVEAMRLPAGNIFMSPIDLNVEHGVIEEPWRPTLRLAAPIPGPADAAAGIVIVNLDVTSLLTEFEGGRTLQHRRLVVNDAGFVLAGGDPATMWGFVFARNPQFPQQHPRVWDLLREGQSGQEQQFREADRLYTLRTIEPHRPSVTGVGMGRLHLIDIGPLPSATDTLTRPAGLVIAALLFAGMALASWQISGVLRDRDVAVHGREAAEGVARRLQSIMDTAADGLIVIDADGVMQAFNAASQRMFGYGVSEVIGQNIAMLMPEPYRSEHDHYLDAYHATGEAKIIGKGREVAGRRKSGEEFPIDLSVGAFNDGGRTGFVGVIRDITERKVLEANLEAQRQELLRSSRDLEQFAYVASHDLKSPLRGIANVANWLREDLTHVLDDEQHHLLDMVEQRIGRMEDLLEGILAYSRAGRVGAAPEVVDPGQVVADIGALGLVPDGFELVADADMPRLVTERAPFQQVLQNLIVNAVTHHDCGRGTIRVRGTVSDGLARFEVEDDGPGVPEQHRERIFRMFERLEPKHRVEGSGIGLALVRKLVERKGGRVDMRPKESGRGSVFSFEWPRNETGKARTET